MYQFKFADIGEGVHEGQVLKWMFKEGDEVHDGDTLCLIETDKVNAEIPSPVDGTIKEINFEVGDTVHVGEVLVVIDDGADNAHVEPEPKVDEEGNKKTPINEGDDHSSKGVVGEIEVSEDVLESSVEASGDEPKKSSIKKVLATPVARKLAKDLGIDIHTIKGSGHAGRVMKEDIYKAKETSDGKDTSSRQAQTVSYNTNVEIPELEISGEVEKVSLSKLRKTIAKNMVLSKSVIPHASTMDEFDVTKLVQFRKEQKQTAEQKGIKLTYMPFIIKALTIALKEFPVFNASYDQKSEELYLKKYYNVGMAVDTDEGLIVPVIKDADQLSILEIAKEIDELATGARERNVSLDKLKGGTFTITNYGAFGSSYGVPVIKHPEVAILGTGMIKKKPVVIDDEIVIRSIMPMSLSIDHRVIDGGDAGRFLRRLKELLNDPMLLLLS
ncbi:dihydrolipoamide acetyltransferase family protein [Haloplasma contractile]|uniref:Dihydrolipoamide acetyltransferase component of pyruvate dehydrogenase complex n=1 Tax=Haloplasma contractile SSD-17B TaxID=1033810 RepID=U2E8P3_9MOLU|nr:dihydrolipoamide acetyltransferase family protein [Haloplasma contractile]ERJ11513.1 Pyruvate dehydrogenase complex E2 component dihydrolipoamide acetyltransferase protein [Haloplasma contractile SSD-17B]